MKWVFLVFAALYAAALALLLIGTYGWFGQERDPVSGVFLMPLGLPWNVAGGIVGLEGPALAILAPAFNLLILLWLWRRPRFSHR
ncbi:MAG: hypothetical protein WA985_08435 [Erythrobacter sp.]|uniref:hypothetical protein n=1 Tax=Erythrobacter sp. TaxID=1042 RepID=UPI003C72C460